MAKEIERAGIPTATITPLTLVAVEVGANRIVQGTSIGYPTGDPTRPPNREREWRRRIVETALEAIQKPVEGQQVFEVKTDLRTVGDYI